LIYRPTTLCVAVNVQALLEGREICHVGKIDLEVPSSVFIGRSTASVYQATDEGELPVGSKS
jgi:hypothetical protein